MISTEITTPNAIDPTHETTQPKIQHYNTTASQPGLAGPVSLTLRKPFMKILQISGIWIMTFVNNTVA